ncbi:hypothetical protein FVEN_g1118 [Fusarium venenatum]|uniref:BZIP domain-containing protein n=1 Tax=Fusarium venenatum TaxID=56646 RepID=A0A2L2TPE2_9HYPO|nr:uncharacterized protein FVRRES_10450 [Fusarium venenatum]KAG8361491.1 hypothetical protein FVEN_g1118 [Fusarium venenatum]KAH6967054.1 hypothetical protein EDB82DRAFT_517873 [Fusarium venenatum]CEI70373.1 unnamed protein product [Fusarium venenatum]
MAAPQQIVVEPMTQQLLVQKAGEDWTGVTSTAERRKLQNRLNKRSQYLRKRQKLEKARIAAKADSPTTSNRPEDTTLQRSPNAMMQAIIETCEIFDSPDISQRVFALASMAYLDYVMNAPRISQLPILITLNVTIAIAKNATLMGFDRERMCMDEAISPFNQSGPWPSSYNPPKALEPTPVQKTVLHHPWLDIFPFPKFRDNAILATDAEILDDGELCEDVAEVNLMNTEKPSLIVWGDASLPHSWEASPLFLRKWGWLLQGCPEMLEATNRWRQSRGEKLLHWHSN